MRPQEGEDGELPIDAKSTYNYAVVKLSGHGIKVFNTFNLQGHLLHSLTPTTGHRGNCGALVCKRNRKRKSCVRSPARLSWGSPGQQRPRRPRHPRHRHHDRRLARGLIDKCGLVVRYAIHKANISFSLRRSPPALSLACPLPLRNLNISLFLFHVLQHGQSAAGHSRTTGLEHVG